MPTSPSFVTITLKGPGKNALSTPLLVAQAALGVAFGVAAMLPLVELPFAVVQE
jgi:hypothetical protein